MSDTPRTDAGLEYDNTTVDGVKEFTRQLERELAAANARIKRLEKALDKTTKIGSKHIKQLEEAGDAMEKYIHDQTNTRFIICAIRWREAREAKL